MANITKIKKKLASLQAQKEKEELKYKTAVEKLTDKYNEDSKNLKEAYESKLADLKQDNANKLAEINPEIEFYTKQKNQIEKLQAQMDSLERATEERLTKNTKDSETVEVAEVEDNEGYYQ